MDLFLSWSGKRSKAVAEALSVWFNEVIQAVEPWISSDIDKGVRWSQEVAARLERSKVGIICLTQDNLSSPWILFEAGALSKTKDALVCTFLLDLSPADVTQPLGQFQHITQDKEDFRKLIKTINSVVQKVGEKSLPDAVLNTVFDTNWSHLERTLATIRSSTDGEVKKPRKDREIPEDSLLSLRMQERQFTHLGYGNMQKRKLQIFVSSTYEDLIDYRLAAMEAIFAAGHIPAAMEQFSPGDETAWEKIQTWIDESDAFILILGGRYGSIEPLSGKSYVQLEYEYAQEKKKPFFALVVSKEHQEQRIKAHGSKVLENEYPDKYKQFHKLVTERLCRFWNDEKDIKAAIFQKLPEWAQKPELVGWTRADEVPTTATMNELARPSQENRELRSRMEAREERFDGLTFEEMVKMLREHRIPDILVKSVLSVKPSLGSRNSIDQSFAKVCRKRDQAKRLQHAGDLFEVFHDTLSRNPIMTGNHSYVRSFMDILVSHGIVSKKDLREDDRSLSYFEYTLTELGRRFRNRMLLVGDSAGREVLWRVTPDENSGNIS